VAVGVYFSWKQFFGMTIKPKPQAGDNEKEAAENARKGLPPPERVFEKVNGDDRGR